jgi:hypothetical protein
VLQPSEAKQHLTQGACLMELVQGKPKGLKGLASKVLSAQYQSAGRLFLDIESPLPDRYITIRPEHIAFEVTAAQALGKLLYGDLTSDHDSDTVSPMTTDTAPDLTGLTFTDDIGTTFTVLGNRRWTGDEDGGFYVWDVLNDSIVPGGAIVSLAEGSLKHYVAEPEVCRWQMESYDEDGLCVVDCGRPIDPDEQRGLCPWHADAMSISDYDFERRVEAGETWSR